MIAASLESGLAVAACAGVMVDASVLAGKTVCGRKGSDHWQEFHGTMGDLIDYKLGPGHRVDPTKKVGIWTAAGTSVTYTYNAWSPSVTYTYTVFRIGDDTSQRYCLDGSGIPEVSVVPGQIACTSYP